MIENKLTGSYELLSASFERWIAHELLASPGDEDGQATVGEWIESGGKDNFEPAANFLPKFKKKYWPMLSGFAKDISLELIGSLAFEILAKGII